MSLTDFHLANQSSIYIECIEVHHPLWAEPIRYVSNVYNGVTVKHQTGSSQYFYPFGQFVLKLGSDKDDLNQSMDIIIGDLGLEIPKLLKQLKLSNNKIRPKLTYRVYLHDNLNFPLKVIDNLEITSSSRDHQGTTFKAESEKINSNGSGLIYNVLNFETLKGFF